MYAEKMLLDHAEKIGDKKQFPKLIQELESNIEKIAKSNKNKPLLILFL